MAKAKFNSPLRHATCHVCGGPRTFIDGASLRIKRQEAGVSLRRLAKQMAYSAPYLCDLELNRRDCSLDLAKRYLEAIDAVR